MKKLIFSGVLSAVLIAVTFFGLTTNRAKAATIPTGTLVVTSNVGARVYINNISKGTVATTSMFTIALVPGQYTVKLAKINYADAVINNVVVTVGQTTSVNKDLVYMLGSLKVLASPVATAVKVYNSARPDVLVKSATTNASSTVPSLISIKVTI